MKYAIIGTGGIGGYYGGLLAKAGREVHFLLHSDYEQVKREGLQVDSVDGSYHLDHVAAYNDTHKMPPCDVVIVALKSIVNDQLPEMLSPIVHPNSIVLLIQNGIGLEEDLQKAMPEAQIAGGVAYICALKTEPGHVTHLGLGRLQVGDYSVHDKALLQEMIGDMVACGINAEPMDYLEMRWKKAVLNMPLNGMTVAVAAPSGPSLTERPQMAELIRRMMMEVITVARACGVETLDSTYADRMMELTAHMPAFASSMKFDYDHGLPLELYYLYQRPIAEAHRHGCVMPLLEMLAAEMDFLQSQNTTTVSLEKLHR